MDAIADYAFHLFRFVFRVKIFFTIKYKFLIKRHTHSANVAINQITECGAKSRRSTEPANCFYGFT